ncbi:ABC transporter permease [Blastopirellula marina]|uniref:ABC transporter n=1 Tax=Blastopirellula marina TaxID=124 RepID=A0A2S8G2W4_9BACT|nr:ABC transporter permease [Blastopirellula marina]PQO38474.1 ABC transporter [Blastopirellula marina]PTL45131.1 ABC transporter permease [Blastopirellula marina]
MGKVINLAWSFLWESPLRVALTILATAAATCLVIWVASGYDALAKTFDDYANLSMGRYELAIAPIETKEEQFIPANVLADLTADPKVLNADPIWAVRVEIVPPKSDAASSEAHEIRPGEGGPRGFGGGPGSGPPGMLPGSLLMITDSPEPPFEMVRGKWLPREATDIPLAVVRAETAERMGIDVGDELTLEWNEKEHTLRVIGILDAPKLAGAGDSALPILAPSKGEIFLTVAAAKPIFPEAPKISLIALSLQEGTDINKFRFGWAPKLASYSTPVQFQQAFEVEEALDQSAAASNVRLQSFAATGVAMLVALLVVLCTLSMGVNERIRHYAILRSLSFTKFQIGQLIALEGLFLGGLGFLAGLIVSWLVLMAVGQAAARMLHHGALLGSYSIGLGMAATLGGAFLAALIPAYRATRVKPIDAMAPAEESSGGESFSRRGLLIGLLLIAVNPVLTFLVPPPFDASIPIFLIIGFASMAVGFILISPAVVAAIDRWGSPLLARLLHIDPKLLSCQITSHLWRTVGAAVSLAVGVGLFIGIQVWGFTMLEGFIPGPWAPDALIQFGDDGLPATKLEAIAKLPGIDSQRIYPIVVEQPRMEEDLTNSAERASIIRQDNIVIVGIDADRAFSGENPFFQFEWVAGTPADAVAKMASGRGCIVPDHFLRETGLKIGDTFALVPPENSAGVVAYEIAGAVKLPGWHWQTKLTGFRTRTHRAAALVFANYPRVAEDFDLPNASHVWFDLTSPDADVDKLQAKATQVYLSEFADRESNTSAPAEAGVRVIPVDRIREATRGAARRWIWVISQVPLIASLIASIGVLNVFLASVRARRWEFGVLRGIGITSSTIIRAVLAEGILIGIVACTLSLGFGVMSGWCGCGIAQYMSFFGGMHPDLVVPWDAISIGLIGLMSLAILSAIWPAYSIGRTRPLVLLQEGRSAF